MFGWIKEIILCKKQDKKINLIKQECLRYGIPYEVRDHWQDYYFGFSGKYPINGYDLVNFKYDSMVGDIVPLFENDLHTHMYKITACSRLSGSDHIGYPYEFDLQYCCTLA